MAKDPWTDPDPQPGDFEADIAALRSEDVQVVEAGSRATVKYVISLEGEDAALLEQLARRRGKEMDEVVADLLRAAG